MNANELRIGNFVYENNGNVAVIKGSHVIGTITVIYDKFNPKIEQQSIKLIKPIRLTEEWLLKFGFEKCETSEEQGYQKGVYKIFINSLGEVNFCFFNFGGWYKPIEYVHQLQNLYFAITGKELEFSSAAQHTNT